MDSARRGESGWARNPGPAVRYPCARDGAGNLVLAAALDRATLRPGAPFACVLCGESVIPVLGRRRARHFRHASGLPCGAGGEGALHRAAKELLAAVYRDCLAGGIPYELARTVPAACHARHPALAARCPVLPREVAREDLTRRFDRVAVERRDGAFCPDLLLWSDADPARRCYVEIVVGHPTPDAKRAAGVPLLELFVASPADLTWLAVPRLVETPGRVALAHWPAQVPCDCALAQAARQPRSVVAAATVAPPHRAMRRSAAPSAARGRAARPGVDLALHPPPGVPQPGEGDCQALAAQADAIVYFAARLAGGAPPVAAALGSLADRYRLDDSPDCLICAHGRWYLGVEYGFPSRCFCDRHERAGPRERAAACPDFALDEALPR